MVRFFLGTKDFLRTVQTGSWLNRYVRFTKVVDRNHVFFFHHPLLMVRLQFISNQLPLHLVAIDHHISITIKLSINSTQRHFSFHYSYLPNHWNPSSLACPIPHYFISGLSYFLTHTIFKLYSFALRYNCRSFIHWDENARNISTGLISSASGSEWMTIAL